MLWKATHWARGNGKESSPVYKLQVTCLSVYKSDSHSGFFSEWMCLMTNTYKVYEIQIQTRIYAHGPGQTGVLSRHRCNWTNALLWVGSCWCVTAMEFVYGVQGHTGWFSWSMFVYGSRRICLHMFHIFGVFGFMRQQHHHTELLPPHLEEPTFLFVFLFIHCHPNSIWFVLTYLRELLLIIRFSFKFM